MEDGRSLIKLKDPTSSLAAVASPASPRQLGQQWPEGSPEVITFHPSYIETVLRDKVVFDKDRVKKAKTNIVDRIIQKFQRVKDDLTSMDILDTPEATMLHEVCDTLSWIFVFFTPSRLLADKSESYSRRSRI